MAEIPFATLPATPGVYALYRGAEPVYLGLAVVHGGIRRRLRDHLDTRLDLSRSPFRRGVAEHLGLAADRGGKLRPQLMTPELQDAVDEWVATCELAWLEASNSEDARTLEQQLLAERKPPLNESVSPS